MSNKANISFHYTTEPFYFPNRNQLKEFLQFLFKAEKKELDSLSYVFCTDEYLYEYNKTYLKHYTLTDIITFELSGKNEPIIGDIYISIDRVKENSKTHNTSFIKELHRVIFHGALHLCGYKDKSSEQQKLMRQKEEHYLNAYFVPRDTVSLRNITN
jgi:probable rRNA maturation factor